MFDSHNLERLLANIKWKGTYSDNGLLKEWLARRPSLSLFFFSFNLYKIIENRANRSRANIFF